jgi:hypothetical protein
MQGGHRDAVQGRAVAAVEASDAVERDALTPAATAARRGDLDPRVYGRARADVPQCSRAAVAEHRPGPAGQHGGQPAAARRRTRVPDRVDAAVDAVETAGVEAVLHGVARAAEVDQLPARDDPVLEFGEPGDPLLTRSTYCRYLR